jgi:hypothetical protein
MRAIQQPSECANVPNLKRISSEGQDTYSMELNQCNINPVHNKNI